MVVFKYGRHYWDVVEWNLMFKDLANSADKEKRHSIRVGEKSFLPPHNLHVIGHGLNFVYLFLLQRGAFEEDGGLC